MRPRSKTPDAVIARIASGANGIVTRRELLAAGVTVAEIKHRLRSGLLSPQYPGVYRVGHTAPSLEARYMAGVRACGAGACLSGKAAGFLYGLVKGRPPPPEVTSPGQRRVRGIRARHCRRLDRRDLTSYRGIPITTIPRTLVDLAAVLAADELALACHEAGVRHGTTPRQVEAVLARRPNSPGARKLRAVLRGDVNVTLSKLESNFLRLLNEARLPLPVTNRPAGEHRVDCRWQKYRLTVELDSFRYHNSRYAWEHDRQREREAYARGDQFRRYTWADVVEDSAAMKFELNRLLGRRLQPGSLHDPN